MEQKLLCVNEFNFKNFNQSINFVNIKLLQIWVFFQDILDERVNVLAYRVDWLVDVMLFTVCLTDALVFGKVFFCISCSS